MNTLETQIIYKETNTKIVTHYTFEFINFILHQETTLAITLYNNNDNGNSIILDRILYKIEGDEYSQWGDDDTYIESIIQRELQKFNTENTSE